MSDLEESLSRELREVAGSLRIPSMPPLPQERPRAVRPGPALLVAAAVVLLVAGAVAVGLLTRGGQEPAPISPTPRPSTSSAPSASPAPGPTPAGVRIRKGLPAVPYVLDQRLYVDGQQVPGTWWSVWHGDTAWLGLRTDYTWWWGRDATPQDLGGQHDAPPVISPNGRFLALPDTQDGRGVLTGLDTGADPGAGGSGLGSVPVDLGDPQDGSAVTVRAVTDDGRVISQGTKASLLWLPLVGTGERIVDLSVTAPEQVVLANTPAGLIVSDGTGDVDDPSAREPYLAEISDRGELTRVATLPTHDDLAVSTSGEWLAWVPAGTEGGEVTVVRELLAKAVDGMEQTTLRPPSGWDFRVRAWSWEDGENLVAPLLARSGAGGEALARCNVVVARCVLIGSD